MLDALHLDPASEVPLYRQLHAQMRLWIDSGHLADGERLPPTRELAGRLGVNRATVAAAYELLENEGLLYGHVGRGSFVRFRAGGPRPDSESALPLFALPDTSARINFASSRPPADLFPLDDFREAARAALSGNDLSGILELGSPYGYRPLCDWLLARLRAEGTAGPQDDLMITNGCQQALDLLCRALSRAGGPVLVEDPVTPGLRAVFDLAGLRLVGVPVGSAGVEIAELDRLVRSNPPQALVLTPNFQNPTGSSLPPAARQEILKLMRRHRLLVVENDIYGMLRYEGSPPESLKQQESSVVQVGSFSKVLSPGLRVGWLVGPKTLVERCARVKQWTDLHTDQLAQAVLHQFVASGSFARHCRRVVAAGAERLRATLSACARHFPPGSRWTRPQGGMHVWVSLPAPIDSDQMLARARAAGVSYLPGRYFAVDRMEPGALRLSFAGIEPARIEEGIRILGEVCRAEREWARSREPSHLAPVVI